MSEVTTKEMGRECHDCGVGEGQLHEWNACDTERCPFCGGQLASCFCKYRLLDYRLDFTLPEYGLPHDIWTDGLSSEESAQWRKLCEAKGRYPWIEYPVLCARCGSRVTSFFKVSDWEWKKYIQPDIQGKVLCKACYDWIKEITIDDEG